jgi:Mrp family chromosome partitioning ATPase
MSATDRAFIKAYAKDPAPLADPEMQSPAPTTIPLGGLPRASTSAVVASSGLKLAASAPVASSRVLEQIYHEGSLYRVEAPAPSAPRRAAVPAPHFQLPPRTSPRRNVRKSLLKLLGHESDVATPMPVEPPHARSMRVARVDRAVSFAKAAPPSIAPPAVAHTDYPSSAPQARVAMPAAPETRAPETGTPELYRAPAERPAQPPRPARRKALRPALQHAPPAGSVVAPDAPATRPIAPAAFGQATAAADNPPPISGGAKSLAAPPAPAIEQPAAVIEPPVENTVDLAAELGPRIEVHGHWDDESLAASGSIVVLKEPSYLDYTTPLPVIELRLDGLPETAIPAPIAAMNSVLQESTAAAAPNFRVDPPHAAIAGPPHSKFVPPAVEQPKDLTLASQPETGISAEQGEAPAGSDGSVQPQSEALVPASELSAAKPTIAELSTSEPTSLEAAALLAEPAIESALEPELVETLAEADLDFADLETLYPTAEPLEPDAAGVKKSESETQPRASCNPVWEVDQFQWPATVERLVTDQDGYFGQASGRLLAAVRDGLRTLAITGSRRGEGRTTLALCLARAAARAGIQVAVIDADFGRPQLAARIGLEVTSGWQEAAIGQIPLSEAAIRSLADNITILPLDASAARTELSLADPRVTATLRAAAATFELVILDLGPLSGSEHALFPEEEACPLDAAIIVRDLRYASAAESEAIGERLYAAGVEAVGIAENFVATEDSAAA